MRKQKQERLDLQKVRADNYEFHFQCRKYFEQLPDELKRNYQRLSAFVGEAWLTVWGAVYLSDEQEAKLIDIANKNNLDAWYLIRFYNCDDGWQQLQDEWKLLPEVLDFDFVHIDLCTKEPLVHTVHRQDAIRAELEALK